MNDFLWLDQIQPSHFSIVGDRALNLSLLRRCGNLVLPGGVITSIAFEQFFTSIRWLEPLADLPHAALHLNLDDARQLQAIARQIRHSIDTTPLTADWLNQDWNAPALLLRPQVLHFKEANDWLAPQVCWAELDAIATAVKRVWGEVFRAKSLLYWQRSNLPLQEIRLAVLVLPISQAIASGRVRISATEKTIEGQRGLSGLAGLEDAIAPDLLTLPPAIASPHYLQLSRDRQFDCLEQIVDPTPQPILDAEQVQPLLQVAQSIAPHLSDIDFEWLLTEEQFWLTQVRSLPVVPQSIDAVLVRGLAASAGRSIGTAHVLSGDKLPADLPADSIVIASKIAIESSFSRIRGFAIEQGGLTSHSAIIARELGIPAIVGATNATQRVQTGDRVCLDGDRGLLYRVDSDAPAENAAPQAIALPALNTRLMVNLSQLATLEAVRHLPIAGVGLLRSELLLLDLLQTPVTPDTIAQIVDRIRPIAEAMYPRPVYYRSIDRAIIEGETNPLLGLHGTFSYQLEGDWFERELLALRRLQQEGYDNLHLLLPFVRTVEEFRFCRSRIQQAGLMQANFQLWIMAEVPSILFLLPEYVKAGAQGIAIGTNDLTQLLLGIDRDQPHFARYSAKHPAVLQAIRQLIQTARQLQIPCSICGQAPSQFPELVALLVQWGITSISVEPQAIEPTARAIATLTPDLIRPSHEDCGFQS